jgi:hypothetical protein
MRFALRSNLGATEVVVFEILTAKEARRCKVPLRFLNAFKTQHNRTITNLKRLPNFLWDSLFLNKPDELNLNVMNTKYSGLLSKQRILSGCSNIQPSSLQRVKKRCHHRLYLHHEHHLCMKLKMLWHPD